MSKEIKNTEIIRLDYDDNPIDIADKFAFILEKFGISVEYIDNDGYQDYVELEIKKI